MINQDVRNGLVLDMPVFGNANDYSGNGYNGIVTGATLTTNRFNRSNRAYSFDGNDYIGTSNVPGKTGSLSLAFWFNPSSVNDNSYIISAGNGGATDTGVGIYIVSTTNKLRINWRYGTEGSSLNGDVFSTTVIQLNTWYHAVVTFVPGNPGAVKVYINGVYENQNITLPFNEIRSSNPIWTIGKHWAGWNLYFNGKISDVRIFNRILTQAELLKLYKL